MRAVSEAQQNLSVGQGILKFFDLICYLGGGKEVYSVNSVCLIRLVPFIQFGDLTASSRQNPIRNRLKNRGLPCL